MMLLDLADVGIKQLVDKQRAPIAMYSVAIVQLATLEHDTIRPFSPPSTAVAFTACCSTALQGFTSDGEEKFDTRLRSRERLSAHGPDKQANHSRAASPHFPRVWAR